MDRFDVTKARTALGSSQQSRADQVRTHLAQLGITEDDIAAAISWARQSPARSPAVASTGN
jgi:hypothetical protein